MIAHATLTSQHRQPEVFRRHIRMTQKIPFMRGMFQVGSLEDSVFDQAVGRASGTSSHSNILPHRLAPTRIDAPMFVKGSFGVLS